jgi:hypothetical protein
VKEEEGGKARHQISVLTHPSKLVQTDKLTNPTHLYYSQDGVGCKCVGHHYCVFRVFSWRSWWRWSEEGEGGTQDLTPPALLPAGHTTKANQHHERRRQMIGKNNNIYYQKYNNFKKIKRK